MISRSEEILAVLGMTEAFGRYKVDPKIVEKMTKLATALADNSEMFKRFAESLLNMAQANAKTDKRKKLYTGDPEQQLEMAKSYLDKINKDLPEINALFQQANQV